MRVIIFLAFVAVLALPAQAAQHATTITVEQFEQVLAASENAHPADADLARQLSGMELTERLSTARLARLKAGLPGENSQQALVALADASARATSQPQARPSRAAPDACFGRALREYERAPVTQFYCHARYHPL
jgi:hypothetical protein